MEILEILGQLNQDIKDVFQYNIETAKTNTVPTRNDPNLTFPIGSDKKGKLLETCVLMVDIRNSTKISKQLKADKIRLGKIYSAFIHSMAEIADDYGYVRNIIGDRLMVVFEPQDCFSNSIKCAALMYTVASRILSKHVAIDSFKVGIGIEYGEMLVVKTGIKKKHEEQSEYKNLVWIGDAANTASKLCDFANKEYNSPLFKINYEYSWFNKVPKAKDPLKPMDHWMFGMADPKEHEQEYDWVTTTSIRTAVLNAEELSNDLILNEKGLTYQEKKVVNFSIEKRAGLSAPILISGKVYDGFKAAEPKSEFLQYLSKKGYPNQPNSSNGIYGGGLVFKEIGQIKIV